MDRERGEPRTMDATFVRSLAVTVVAFCAGVGVAHVGQPARAAAAALQPAAIDLAAFGPADLPAPGAITPNLQSKLLVAADGMTAAVQIGTVFKHMHADANEIQYVLAGTGNEWLGDKQIALKPGLLVIVPAGTSHGGTGDPQLKILAIKTPPQAATDIHPVP